jgi:6-phosphogluconolactonase (cycloisomerase 2 family)
MAPDHGKDSETSRWNLSARRNDVDPKPHVAGVSTYLPKEQLINDTRTSSASNAVYVQTNSSPNEVIAFRRSNDGSLDRIGSVATDGDGSGSPHLQSQGSVALTGDGQHLLVTNAGSDDVSVFSVASDGSLELRDRVDTGSTPRSVAERDGLVVVMNTGVPSLMSFQLGADGIKPVSGGDQALASDADPAQVGFSPDGSMVVITQRGTDSIVTYQVEADGSFGASSTVASQGPTPYGFGFASGGTLVVTEAFRAEKGAAAASSYAIVDGSLEPRSGSVGNGRSEICWAVVTPDGRFAFTTNFADGAVSRYAIAADGSLSLEDATAGIAVEGMTGLRDEDLSSDGRFLYVVDTDGGRIYGWSVGADGALEPVGSWDGLPATVAGLAAR